MAWFKSIMRQPAPRAAACWVTAQYIRLVRSTGRWTTEGAEFPTRQLAEGQPFLAAFWHGRLFMMSEAWPYDAGFNMVVSQHPDGQLIAQTIGHLGFGSISGSTTQGGTAVMRAMLRALKDGECVGLTPDGPQGPRMHASVGIVHAARLSGAPILPLAYTARPSWLLPSWDRLMIPLPFSRGIVRWGEPIEIARDASDEDVAKTAKLLEARLNQIVHQLDDSLGLPGVEPAVVEAEA
ncbi:MAG: lysophospholipid acyltransferase family protein [Rhodospirillaceae bacterium]|jgi:hypothetical protein|nr:lysophospholipid acyltransferase family protein [Rhodospirillaceae bacterium]MBT5459418.1 lysophospholipid acyltransferase family protein [Rhodospirillaceae bacterium]